MTRQIRHPGKNADPASFFQDQLDWLATAGSVLTVHGAVAGAAAPPDASVLGEFHRVIIGLDGALPIEHPAADGQRRVLDLKRGQVLVLPPGSWHRTRPCTGVGMALVLFPDALRLAAAQHGPAQDPMKAARIVLQSPGPPSPALRRLLRTLVELAESDPVPAARLVEAMAGLIWTRLQEPAPASLGKAAATWLAIAAQLDECEPYFPSREDLAARLRLSADHLGRLCRDHAGESYTRYVNRRRLNLACRLLAESPHTVKEIAALSGFESADYFCRVFRREIGRTPSEYRGRRTDHGRSA